MPPEMIVTEKIIVTPDEPVTRELGPNELVNVSASPDGGLRVIQEIRFEDEVGGHYNLTVTEVQGNLGMNTRDGKTEYEFSRK
ncbi:hypothetical protein HYV22_02535 [Candidatus Gottesmanbacteria bacterium]|nr:hypothetical protein [Candidatus Gottesmanbacteria bacterium]